MAALAPPPRSVVEAFRAVGPLSPIAGGQGTSWSAGGLVLKPDVPPQLQQWLAEKVGTIDRTGFRLADPVPTIHGTWVHEGWSAARHVDGDEPDRSSTAGWRSVVAAGRAFHRAAATVAYPPLLHVRSDCWAVADRMTWGEQPLSVGSELADCAHRLIAALAPLGPPQLIHGDLSGNVLIAPDLPPAVIDLAPYWRPPAYAEGIVVADAMTWHGAPATLTDDLGVPVAAVARGLLFRLLTDEQRATSSPAPLTHRAVSRYLDATIRLGL
jgi:uncharacterized protein (TIGR02569 family)